MSILAHHCTDRTVMGMIMAVVHLLQAVQVQVQVRTRHMIGCIHYFQFVPGSFYTRTVLHCTSLPRSLLMKNS